MKIEGYEQFITEWRRLAPNGVVKAITSDGRQVEAIEPPSSEHVWHECRKTQLRMFVEALSVIQQITDSIEEELQDVFLDQTEAFPRLKEYVDNLKRSAMLDCGMGDPPSTDV